MQSPIQTAASNGALSNAAPGSEVIRTTSNYEDISRFGERIDGWADLIDGMGHRALGVAQAFSTNVAARYIPTAAYACGPLHEDGRSAPRDYQYVHITAGARAVVCISAYGRDLYLSWDVFVKRLWNMSFITLLVIVSAAAGFMLERDIMRFFKREPNYFEMQNNTELMFAVHHALLQSADSVGIHASMLRLKNQFHGGLRDRLV